MFAVSDVEGLVRSLPAGEWVAISEERSAVIAHGPDLAEVMGRAKSMGEALPLIVRSSDLAAMQMFF